MDRLIILSQRKTRAIKAGFKRFLYAEIDWNLPLVIIKGHRGSGKTTLMLQRAKALLSISGHRLQIGTNRGVSHGLFSNS